MKCLFAIYTPWRSSHAPHCQYTEASTGGENKSEMQEEELEQNARELLRLSADRPRSVHTAFHKLHSEWLLVTCGYSIYTA